MRRSVDVIVSGVALVALSPFLTLLALAVRLSMGSPVLFRQERAGLHGRPFVIFKFRTMMDVSDRDGVPLPDRQRLTRLGRFMRATSLDELPELANVFKGDMSLVGPRPLLCEYLPLYTPYQATRHSVKPGITGWAQVNGRNETEWEERLEMDAWYVENRSLWLDLRILVKTIPQVLSLRGISHPGRVTMEPFRGTSEHRVERPGGEPA